MRIVALGCLVAFVCLSVIFGTFLITRFVILILPSSLTRFTIIVDITRLALAVALAYAWLRVWKAITDWYFWRSIAAGHTRPR
jgi:hypothetical protein